MRRAAVAAIAALDHHDAASAVLMIEAARSQLGDIDERYAGAPLTPVRRTLALASAELDAAQSDALRDPAAARAGLVIWLAHAPAWSGAVITAEPQSLYAAARLAAVETGP